MDPQQEQQQDVLVFEALPQRIDANKNKRRRKGGAGDAAAAAAVAAPPPSSSDQQQQQQPEPQQLDQQQQTSRPAATAVPDQQTNGQAAASLAVAAANAGGGGGGFTAGFGLGDINGGMEQQQQAAAPQHVADAAGYRSAAVGEHKFEYLDHTADVQLHAWGTSLREAFEQVGLAMFNYMTPIDALRLDDTCTREIQASGHDMHSLLFNFLDELLFTYATEYIMFAVLDVTHLDTQEGAFAITATGRGEKFDRSRHECGTEVKAITYSAMQIREAEGDAEVFVIVDI